MRRIWGYSIDHVYSVYIGLKFSRDSLSSSLVISLTWLPTESFTHLCSYWTLYLVVATIHITSDRGSEFVSNFFQSLGTALDMWLYFTSGYYPEGDGQTKCTNQTLEQYLHVYCNYQQDNWSKLLPLVEFAYNNAPSTTTDVSPFFANKRYYLNITVYPKHNIASSQACNFTVDFNELQSTLKAENSMAHQHYQKSVDV